MHNSSLVSFLKSLNSEELERFRDFIKSPFFNKLSSVINLFEVLSEYAPEFDSPEIKKELVYKKVFKSIKYNDKVMRNTMSKFQKCGEKFLEYLRLECDGALRHTLILNESLKRKLYHLFNENLKIAEELQRKSPRNDDYFYNNMKIWEVKAAFDAIENTKKEKSISSDAMEGYLLNFFLLYYYKICIAKLNQMKDYNYKSKLELFPVISKYYFDNNYPESEIVSIYYNIVNMYLYPKIDKYFFDAMKFVEKYTGRINTHEKYNIYVCFSNYCLVKIAEGKAHFIKVLFEINKKIIEEKLYSPRSVTSIVPLLFKNVVKAGSQAKEFDWTLKFIKENIHKVAEDVREDLYNYCCAYLHFYKNDIDKSLDFVSRIKYHNVFDKIDINVLLMQIYYEKGLTDELFYLTDTFKHFLKSCESLSEKIKQQYKNYVNTILNLFRIKLNKKTLNHSLKESILNFKIYEKMWLVSKLNEVERE